MSGNMKKLFADRYKILVVYISHFSETLNFRCAISPPGFFWKAAILKLFSGFHFFLGCLKHAIYFSESGRKKSGRAPLEMTQIRQRQRAQKKNQKKSKNISTCLYFRHRNYRNAWFWKSYKKLSNKTWFSEFLVPREERIFKKMLQEINLLWIRSKTGVCVAGQIFLFFFVFFSILGFSKSARAPSPAGLHSSPKDKPYALRWPRRGAC